MSLTLLVTTFGAACAAPTGENESAEGVSSDEVRSARSYLLVSCNGTVRSGSTPASVRMVVNTDKAAAKLESLSVRVTYHEKKYRHEVVLTDAAIANGLWSTENGETPGDTTDYGTNYSFNLAAGTTATDFNPFASRVSARRGTLNPKLKTLTLETGSTTSETIQLDECTIENTKLLERTMTLAG